MLTNYSNSPSRELEGRYSEVQCCSGLAMSVNTAQRLLPSPTSSAPVFLSCAVIMRRYHTALSCVAILRACSHLCCFTALRHRPTRMRPSPPSTLPATSHFGHRFNKGFLFMRTCTLYRSRLRQHPHIRVIKRTTSNIFCARAVFSSIHDAGACKFTEPPAKHKRYGLRLISGANMPFVCVMSSSAGPNRE